ncbi:hypothetical protein [Candidatus Marithrix sp. Canyon 246]|nr:hypothetical protein [Candidatus Marithrix sp. Canyon 246]
MKSRKWSVITDPTRLGSPLDIKGINLSITTDEIIDIVRESRVMLRLIL